MKVTWMPRARGSLLAIIEHISQDDPVTAHRFVDDLIDRTEHILSEHPQVGRIGRVHGTYEWVAHKNYVVAYRVTDSKEVHILDVVHAARLWPQDW